MNENSLGGTTLLARLKKGITQKSLAQMIGISASYLSLIEKEKATMPSENVLRMLAEALDLDFAHLMYLSASDSSAHSLIRSPQSEYKVSFGLKVTIDNISLDRRLDSITLHFLPDDPSRKHFDEIYAYRTDSGWKISECDPNSPRGKRVRLVKKVIK